jgi:hypothetical protein
LPTAWPAKQFPDIRAIENIKYELAQPQNALTPAGLRMEGYCAFRRPTPLELRMGDLA